MRSVGAQPGSLDTLTPGSPLNNRGEMGHSECGVSQLPVGVMPVSASCFTRLRSMSHTASTPSS